MQFQELVCSSFLCLSSSQEFRSACFFLNADADRQHLKADLVDGCGDCGVKISTDQSLVVICDIDEAEADVFIVTKLNI